MTKILILITVASLFSCDEKSNSNAIIQIAKLPNELKEISGIAYSNNLIYSIEDSGNKNQIVILDTAATIVKRIKINNTNNTDWEDVTFDTKGNLYIGDFGNNDNLRKDLAIYKIDKSNLKGEKADVAYKISFDYPEQTDFPPKKKNLIFDVEAFFEYNNYFYLFTKNRNKNFDGTSYIYKVPNTAGHHHAQLIKTIITCDNYQNCAITSAAISPDGSKFVVLSHSKIWLFEDYSQSNITEGKVSTYDLKHYSQKEAICFKNKNTLLIADERVKKNGGNLYEVSLKSLK